VDASESGDGHIHVVIGTTRLLGRCNVRAQLPGAKLAEVTAWKRNSEMRSDFVP
jgi:hypothetical protein